MSFFDVRFYSHAVNSSQRTMGKRLFLEFLQGKNVGRIQITNFWRYTSSEDLNNQIATDTPPNIQVERAPQNV